MFRYFFILLLSLNFSFANENVVKTSELELFLFKVGFESLLKDVDITKDKSSLNENEIKTINEKIDLIMSELYKDKRVLLNDRVEQEDIRTFSENELENLKSEIAYLKKEVQELKEKKVEKKTPHVIIKPKVKETKIVDEYEGMRAIVTVNNSRVRTYPSRNNNILKEFPKGKIIYLDYCDKFAWCKIKDKNEYIAKQLLWIYK